MSYFATFMSVMLYWYAMLYFCWTQGEDARVDNGTIGETHCHVSYLCSMEAN